VFYLGEAEGPVRVMGVCGHIIILPWALYFHESSAHFDICGNWSPRARQGNKEFLNHSIGLLEAEL